MLKAHRTAFTRLVHEAQLIQKHGNGEGLLNRKEEYARNLIPELILEEPAWRKKNQHTSNKTQGGGTKRNTDDIKVGEERRNKRRRSDRPKSRSPR